MESEAIGILPDQVHVVANAPAPTPLEQSVQVNQNRRTNRLLQTVLSALTNQKTLP